MASIFALQLMVGVLGFAPSSQETTRYIRAVATHVNLAVSFALIIASGGTASLFAWGSLVVSVHQVGNFWSEELPGPNAFIQGGVP